MQGQSGERHEGETIFEDAGLLGEFLEHFVITVSTITALESVCCVFLRFQSKNLAGRATCATRWRCCARIFSCML